VLGFLEWVLLKSAFISGIALGALYATIAIGVVLTYRMSRVVGFVHGGIALVSGFVYWYLTADPTRVSGSGNGGTAYATKEWPKAPAVLVALLVAALLGAIFGAIVTGRMATWPRVTVTTFSLGAMLLLTGITSSIWQGALEIVPSPFGEGKKNVFGYLLTDHQIAVIIILIVLVVTLNFVVTRTKTGVHVRGISDDIEAAELIGVPVRAVSMGVWCLSGTLAGLGGILLTPMTRVGAEYVLFVLIRSMAGASLGGFESLPLALLGAMLFGQVESQVQGGTFGDISSGRREVILMAVLSGGILLVARHKRRASRFSLEEA
jgi:branched-chain amino acid transport system permease protein